MTQAHDIPWPVGILSVVQTPFSEDGAIDEESLARLVEDVLSAQVDGLLAPDGDATRDDLAAWVQRGLDFTLSLLPK